jgi:hypothetical protein
MSAPPDLPSSVFCRRTETLVIAPVVLGGYRCAAILTSLSAIFSDPTLGGKGPLPVPPQIRRKLSLRRRIWGTILPPWPKDP